MADDKPKHKPQAKRTLEEVLRSLKDLVRNDLTREDAARAAGRHASGPPAAADEPESFGEALSRLDEIIDEKIIRPARATPAPPPAAPLADDVEIEWDADAQADPPQVEEAAPVAAEPEATVQPPADAAEPGFGQEALDDADGGAEYRVEPGPEAAAELPEADAADLAALEAIELAPLAPQEPESRSDAPAGPQEAFRFPEPGAGPAAAEFEAAPEDRPAAAAESRERTGSVAADEPDGNRPAFLESDQLESSRADDTDAADNTPSFDAEPMAGASREPAFAAGHRQPFMSTDDPGNHSHRPDTRARPGGPAGRDASVHSRPEAAGPAPSSDSPGANSEPPLLEEEIPVLQDVAPGQAPPPASLPDAAHARDIAIRVIARINIERRKAGETPLDIKTIERLQRYLTEALTKAATGRLK